MNGALGEESYRQRSRDWPLRLLSVILRASQFLEDAAVGSRAKF